MKLLKNFNKDQSVQRLENVLNKEELDNITFFLTSNNTPWYYIKEMVDGEDNRKSFFTHSAYNKFTPTSDLFNLITPILKILNPSAILRIQANLVLAKESPFECPWHVDYKCEKGKTAIFYVTESNGSTVLKNKNEEIKNNGTKNSLIIFPMETPHKMISQTFPEERIVINFNYFN